MVRGIGRVIWLAFLPLSVAIIEVYLLFFCLFVRDALEYISLFGREYMRRACADLHKFTVVGSVMYEYL